MLCFRPYNFFHHHSVYVKTASQFESAGSICLIIVGRRVKVMSICLDLAVVVMQSEIHKMSQSI